MNTLKFALLSLMMVVTQLTSNVVTAAPMRNEGIEKRINLITAVNKSSNFTCKIPQPRSYHVQDLISLNHTIEVSKPIYIVVTRCDAYSGCCDNLSLSCSPVSVDYEDIEIEFYRINGQTTNRWIRVEQHTNCRCDESDGDYRMESVQKPPNVTFVD